MRTCLPFLIILPLLGSLPAFADEPHQSRPIAITWKKTVVDKSFRSEGVAVADINKDGKMDVIVGDVWYEAPDWKLHVIREDRKFDPLNYSQCFGCFADDFNGDGWMDVLIIPFPGAPCYWYENPGTKGGKWLEHMISPSACNETPQYRDLLGDGKRVLIMGVQPKGQENMGQMFWLRPGKDPTQLWEHHPISVPSTKDKVVPGTFRFSHGLGVGDVNGDGRADVLSTDGWWEQPAKLTDEPWEFHPASLGPPCADMFAIDMDGDGRNDILSTSAHGIGFWWHQQKGSKDNPTFFLNEMFLGTPIVTDPRNYLLTQDEKKLLDLENEFRGSKSLRPLHAIPSLCRAARARAADPSRPNLPGHARFTHTFRKDAEPEALFRDWMKVVEGEMLRAGRRQVGVAFSKSGEQTIGVIIFGSGQPVVWDSIRKATPARALLAAEKSQGIVVWDGMKKQLVSQTHAVHLVDINGDGVKDFVTGRRWWAHGPHGDAAPTEPAFLFWFEGKKGKDGIMTFIPHLIDDDSGIATQFAVNDINGDGLLDVVISNKKGVFIFEQVRNQKQ